MEIKQFVWDVVDSNSWLILEEAHGLLFDAVDNTDLYVAIEKLVDLTVVLTHSHFDHIIGLNRVREIRSDAMVISTERCSEYLGNIYRNMSSSATAFMKFYEAGKKSNIEIEPIICEPSDRTFENELELSWCGHIINLIAVHGHSDDGAIGIVDGKYLFSGDTLLHVPTVTRFPSGNSKRFWLEDIPVLEGLKGIETVYPGHGANGKREDMLAVNKMPEKYKK